MDFNREKSQRLKILCFMLIQEWKVAESGTLCHLCSTNSHILYAYCAKYPRFQDDLKRPAFNKENSHFLGLIITISYNICNPEHDQIPIHRCTVYATEGFLGQIKSGINLKNYSQTHPLGCTFCRNFLPTSNKNVKKLFLLSNLKLTLQ